MFTKKWLILIMMSIVRIKADCLWNGKTYSKGPIPTDDPCEICHCLDNDSYDCTVNECPFPKDNCIAKSIPGHCCPGYNCGQNGTCHYKTTILMSGEHLALDSILTDCICLPNGDPSCTNCAIDPEKLNSGCVPTYELNKLCPVDFKCDDHGSNFSKSAQNLNFSHENNDTFSIRNYPEEGISQNVSTSSSIILPFPLSKLNLTYFNSDSRTHELESDYIHNDGFKPDSWKPAKGNDDDWAMPIGANIPIINESILNHNGTELEYSEPNKTSWVGVTSSKPKPFTSLEKESEPDDNENTLNINTKPSQSNNSFDLSSNFKPATPIPHSFRGWNDREPSGFHLNLPAINTEPPQLPKENVSWPQIIPPKSPFINMEKITIFPIPSRKESTDVNSKETEDALTKIYSFTTSSPYNPNNESFLSTILPFPSILGPPLNDFDINNANKHQPNITGPSIARDNINTLHSTVQLPSEIWPDNQPEDIVDKLELSVTSLNHVNHSFNDYKFPNETVTVINTELNPTSDINYKDSFNVNGNSKDEEILATDQVYNYTTTTMPLGETVSHNPNTSVYEANEPIINNPGSNKTSRTFFF